MMIGLIIVTPHEEYLTTTFKCRKIKHSDFNFYANRLLELSWGKLYNCSDPNDAWKILYDYICSSSARRTLSYGGILKCEG